MVDAFNANMFAGFWCLTSLKFSEILICEGVVYHNVVSLFAAK